MDHCLFVSKMVVWGDESGILVGDESGIRVQVFGDEGFFVRCLSSMRKTRVGNKLSIF